MVLSDLRIFAYFNDVNCIIITGKLMLEDFSRILYPGRVMLPRPEPFFGWAAIHWAFIEIKCLWVLGLIKSSPKY